MIDDPLYNGTFTSRGAPLDPDALDLFEAELGQRLPEDYRQFMLEGDGGEFEEFLGIPDVTYLSDLDCAFPVKDSAVPIAPIAKWIGTVKDWIPSEFLPVARNSGGDIVCIGLTGPETGKVYFWQFGGPTGRDSLVPVADSFTEFLAALQPVA